MILADGRVDVYKNNGHFASHFSDAKVLHPEVIRYMDYFVCDYSVFATGESYFITLTFNDYYKAQQTHKTKS